MAQPVIQASFNSGEWAPNLWARTDLAKYKSGAALLRNFFVDYRGGASTRVGTKYVLQAYDSDNPVRLIPFQASISTGYVLEFGEHYLRFHKNGAPVLEGVAGITGATQANPCVVSVVNSYAVGDWVYIFGVSGMTQLNGKYYKITARTGGTITLADLFGNAVNATSYGAWTAGGAVQRVLTLHTPFDAADLATLKFSQNVSVMFLTHPDYVPYQLIFTSETEWLLAPIAFGSNIPLPIGLGATTTLAGGTTYYSYVVTAVDGSGQESARSTVLQVGALQDLRTTVGSITVTWTPVTGAVSYNVYKSDVNIGAVIPAGVPYGYVGNVTGSTFVDANVSPDFSEGPPVPQRPFAQGAGVDSVAITGFGNYTSLPSATFSSPTTGSTATGQPVMFVNAIALVGGGSSYAVNDLLYIGRDTVVRVDTVAAGVITGATVIVEGVYTGTLPTNPVSQTETDGSGSGATFNFGYGVLSVLITNPGSGYQTAPTVTFSAGAPGTATGTPALGGADGGNPSVSSFIQQRFTLAGTGNAPQGVFMSQPGAYYNFDTTSPIQSSDAIAFSIVSGQLNNIKALVPQPGGLIILTDGASFLVNGGSLGAPITPTTITVTAQSFVGCNDMPPIVANADILYVQSKGSSVRNATYNFYANVFTGTDISVLSSHLFFGYQLTEWAWAEEPYKIVWAVRNDGTLLSLTFLKEQEFIGWAHSDTEGSFKSVASIVEPATEGYQNFTYFVIEREVQSQTLQYIEYMPERIYTNGVEDAICVDCAYVYDATPATTFSGATALAGLTVTGLADGEVIPPFTMASNGSFTLASAASKVIVGLAFTAQLQTLYIDTPEAGGGTVQSKMKKIPVVTVRVTETLGLSIGSDFDNLVAMKDLVVGNVGAMTNEVVTDLVTGDAMTAIDPKWQEPGQYCIEQSNPFPATILGVMPEITIGDTVK